MSAMRHSRLGQVVCIWIILLAAPLFAQPAPITDRIEQLHAAISELELSAEQRQELDSLFAEMRKQSAGLAELRRTDPSAARRKSREIAAQARSEVARILTLEQQQALRQRMQQQSEVPPPASQPVSRRNSEPMVAQPPEASALPDYSLPETLPVSEEDLRFRRAGQPLAAGSEAPPISLTDLNGKRLTLNRLPRQPVVLIFGSYSCPSFRQQIPMLNQLAKAHARRAHFLIVYTREAHAVGEWEVQRNRDEGIRVAQHRDKSNRRAAAIATQRALGVKLPIALDDMDDCTVRAYNAFPNGAVVISPDRKIVAAQQWADPFLLDQVLLNLE